MRLIFDLIFIIYAFLYLPYLLVTRRLYQGFAMRFGFIPTTLKERITQKPNVWLHAVSVGEVLMMEGFLNQLMKEFPQYQIVVTVTTKAGYALAQQRLACKTIVLPSPLDMSLIVRRFIDLIRPKIYVAAETEIWPNLLMALEKRHIPAAIINGRISDNSLGRYQMIRALLKPVLATVDMAGMQSQLDATRIRALGAHPQSVKVLGNIKFDDIALGGELVKLSDYGFYGDVLLLIAGSIHPGEEEIMIDVYKELHEKDARWRLVLAPRHIERVGDICQRVKVEGLSAQCLSSVNPTQQFHHKVLVVDTIGHLRSLYALADIVFVGKSLCVGGGHNIIEPAIYGKPVIVGPMMQNFRDIMRCFRELNGVIEVKDKTDFKVRVMELADSSALRQQWGKRARSIIDRHQGASQRTVDALRQYL